MKGILQGLQHAVCEVGGFDWQACLPWWSAIFTAANMTATFSAVFGAFIGALVGGYANYKATRKVETEKREQGHQDTVQADLIATVLEIVLMKGDIATVADTIANIKIKHSAALARGDQLWQAIYKFDLKPSVAQSDRRALVSIHNLRSRTLLERLLAFTGAYHSNMARIEQYHSLRDQFEAAMRDHFYLVGEERRFSKPTDEYRLAIIARMHQYMTFIETDIPRLVNEADELQDLIALVSKQRFGSTDFLRLPREE